MCVRTCDYIPNLLPILDAIGQLILPRPDFPIMLWVPRERFTTSCNSYLPTTPKGRTLSFSVRRPLPSFTKKSWCSTSRSQVRHLQGQAREQKCVSVAQGKGTGIGWTGSSWEILHWEHVPGVARRAALITYLRLSKLKQSRTKHNTNPILGQVRKVPLDELSPMGHQLLIFGL